MTRKEVLRIGEKVGPTDAGRREIIRAEET